MGLAASQARFLAITSRKANCEFRSMEIAQDKLSVTRDLADISQEYQNALNKTTLVWDYDGTGQNPYDLSYGIMMTPSVLNNYTPYLITNRLGAVVVSGAMANVLEELFPGGAANGGADYSDFMDELVTQGIIDSQTQAMFKKLGGGNYNYNPNVGYGAEPMNKNGANLNNVLGLAYQIEQSKEENLNRKLMEFLGGIGGGTGSGLNIYVNGQEADEETKKSLTISDILTKDITVVQIHSDGVHEGDDPGENNADVGRIWKLGISDAAEGSLTDAIYDALANVLGTDDVAKSALKQALSMTMSQFNDTKTIHKNGNRDASSASINEMLKQIQETANSYNQLVFFENSGDKTNSGTAINLTNMVSYMLTMFDGILNGMDRGYFAGPTAASSTYVTDDLSYNFVTQDYDAVTDVTVMKADFYMQLFNNVKNNGWVRDDNIAKDNNRLEQLLKNGNYFITSLNGDGYFYQGRYNENDCIIEVKDTDAIAQAEAEFTSKKAKLTYKEESLDIEMKNLDAEISALTTEYDSVKGLISKNIDKVFQMFQ